MNFRRQLAWIAPMVFAGAVAVQADPSPSGMALIPAGKYQPVFQFVGSPASIPVPAFYLDVRPVTNGDFLAFVRGNPDWRRSRVAAIFADPGYLAAWAEDLVLGPGAPVDAPVVNVSWFAARAYARWLGRRLPTVAEWERAAQVGFSLEKGADEPAYRKAIFDWLSKPAAAIPAAAGSGRPNFYGVRDMVDLVSEWADDFNTESLTGGAGDDSGADGQLFCAAAAATARKFTDYPAFLRAGFRSSLRASYVMPNLGFRCALSK